MPVPYSKPFLDVPGQVALLIARGLDVGAPVEAERLLRQFGYYRLSGYWHPLRKATLEANGSGKLDFVYASDFRSGTTLAQAVGIAEFDRRLRGLFLEASERIEVAVRVAVALLFGPRGPWAHRDPAQFYSKFVSKADPVTGEVPFATWLARVDDHERRSKEQFSAHFREKYEGPHPLWISIEVWDFGMLSRLVGGMSVADQMALAAQFGISRRALFPSWMRAINHVRNVSAHHSRLWNRSPADQAVPPKVGEFPLLDHLATDAFAHTRIYAVAAVMQYLLRIIDPRSAQDWATDMRELFTSFPAVPGVPVEQSGFPQNWYEQPLWDTTGAHRRERLLSWEAFGRAFWREERPRDRRQADAAMGRQEMGAIIQAKDGARCAARARA